MHINTTYGLQTEVESANAYGQKSKVIPAPLDQAYWWSDRNAMRFRNEDS